MNDEVMFAFGGCVCCHRPFAFNPLSVPSIVVDGKREPVCRSCMDLANAERVRQGVPPHPIRPDAYEPVSTHELGD